MIAKSVLRRSRDILVDQFIRTLHRPQRIANAPTVILKLFVRWVASRSAGALYRMYVHIPMKWHWKRADTTIVTANFIRASLLLDQSKPKAAWSAFRRTLTKSSDPYHFFVAAVCLFMGMGRQRDALAIFTRANVLRREKAKAFGLEGSRIRYLEPIWASSIGHLAQTDYLIKHSMLEGRSPAETILYLPRDFKPANQYLFDQWRPHYSVVEDETKLPMQLEALSSLTYDFLAPRTTDGLTLPLWKIAALTYCRWYAEGRGPLLNISSEVQKRARSVLSNVGIPEDAWFVALHVREAKSNAHHALLHDSLNADIFDYAPAIKEIVSRGGWVIRMGDPTMKPLPPSENVFDYCHSQIRSDWMDIYLLAKCRFLLGTSSGPAYVPPIYGAPSVLTNWWPPAQKPWHPQDIFVPKRVRIGNKRILALAESLEEPFGYCNSLSYLKEERGALIENNSPADILGAVMDMFDQINGITNDNEEDIALRNRADYIYKSFDIHGMARLSRDFLRRNDSFLD